MKNTFVLDRTLITGPIIEHTPQCVVDEIRRVNGWKDSSRENVISKIISSSYRTVSPEDVEDRQWIAFFINDDVKQLWTLPSLTRAIKFIRIFMSCAMAESINHIPDRPTFGLQTVGDPESMNACVLYKICRGMAFFSSITRITTVEQMFSAVIISKLSFPEAPRLSTWLRRLMLANASLSDSASIELIHSRFPRESSSSSASSSSSISSAPHFPSTRERVKAPEVQRIEPLSEVHKAVKDEKLSRLEEDQLSLAIKQSLEISRVKDAKDEKKIRLEQDLDVYKYDRKFLHSDKLLQHFRIITDISEMRMTMTNYDHIRCISLAAVDYGIDISRSSSPYRELINLRGCNIRLKEDGKTTFNLTSYAPWDSNMAKEWNRNPFLFSLKHKYISLFPSQFYSNYIEIAKDLGVTDQEIEAIGPEDSLKMSMLINNFHRGWHPNIKNDVTPIALDSMEEIDPLFIVCFGAISDQLIGTTYDELSDLFNANKDFANPFDQGESFSSVNISALKRMCTYPSRWRARDLISIPPERIQKLEKAQERLLKSIHAAEGCLAAHFTAFKPVMKECSVNKDIKLQVINLLTAILNMGMYMRGWKGSGPFPIRALETSSITTDPEIDKRSIDSIALILNLEEKANSIDSKISIGTKVLNLPLLCFSDPDFKESPGGSYGKSIRDRIEIVKSGEHKSAPLESCIRMSSNWFVCTAYRYMDILGLPKPFDIKNLSKIS